jgi:hypothetical protein
VHRERGHHLGAELDVPSIATVELPQERCREERDLCRSLPSPAPNATPHARRIVPAWSYAGNFGASPSQPEKTKRISMVGRRERVRRCNSPIVDDGGNVGR